MKYFRLPPRTAALTALVLVATYNIFCSNARAASSGDWPQWRGPHRDGVSSETGLLQSWPQGGPELNWMFSHAGLGYSSVVIADGRLYSMGARSDGEFAIALDTDTGEEIWSTKIGALLKDDRGDGPRSTPTVHGGYLFALSGQGTLVCLKTTDGTIEWQRTMQELGGSAPRWGYAESVLVDDGKVLCTPGGEKGAIAAFDAKSGQLLWQSLDFKTKAQYSSIVPAHIHGQRQYIQLTMKDIVGVDPNNGHLLWRAEFPGAVAVIPTPVYRDDRVYVTAGYGVGCKAIQIDAQQRPTTLYANKVMKNHHGGVILLGDHVYGYSDNVGWVCQKFDSGQLIWNEKQALGKGSLTYADGRLYCLTEDGWAALIEATPKGYVEYGRFELTPKSQRRSPRGGIWAHPVVTGGKLYLRDQERLFCYDVQASD